MSNPSIREKTYIFVVAVIVHTNGVRGDLDFDGSIAFIGSDPLVITSDPVQGCNSFGRCPALAELKEV